MPTSSRLARLQQIITVALVLAAIGWAVSQWAAGSVRALTGVMVILFGYAIFLAAEFVVLHRVAKADTTPAPAWSEIARAWWAEVTHAPRVFCWRQPFRWRAEPDRDDASHLGRPGVVFIHGFVCNRGFWTPWLSQARERGLAFAAVNLEPVFGSIDDYVPIVEEAVQRITRATGRPPLLVCHSMGGLAARAWLRTTDGTRVRGVVTLGTPHRGTWLARFSHLRNGAQMRRQGSWLRQLEIDEAQRTRPPFSCWYTNCDNIVFPTSTSTLPDAQNHLVRGAAHVDLAFRPEVMRAVLGQAAAL
jgi:pimeloyl-ACP methyl ester carboxylesterase